MARFYSFLDQMLLFLVCTGVKMQIFNQKNNICTLVVQNIGYLSKRLELLDWERWNFSHLQMKSCPTKYQKTIFFSMEQFIVKTQFEISKYLLWIFMSFKYLWGPFWKICSTRPQDFGGLKGQCKKKHVAWCFLSTRTTNM